MRGTHTALARELIRAGVAGGDAKAQSERLMRIERRPAAIDQQTQAIFTKTEREAASLKKVAAMFDALLAALSDGDAIEGAQDDEA